MSAYPVRRAHGERLGKTVAAKSLLARTVLLTPKELQPVELKIIDPKNGDDFAPFKQLPNVYCGEAAPDAIHEVYQELCRRQSEEGSRSYNRMVVFIDEFASLISLIDSKAEKERVQKEFALLALLSRSFRISLIMATQQPSAQMFGSGGSGVREQFSVCLIGDSGSETINMLFDADSREKIKAFGSIGGRGVGWLSLNGGLARPVRVPRVSNIDSLNAIIKNNLKEAF